jgi:peptide/nickel transport system ATP-binding protein
MPILTLQNIGVGIRQNGHTLPILKSISFSLERGAILALVGESGCGKSTLCKTVAGLLPVNFRKEGTITIHNKSGDTVITPDSARQIYSELWGTEIGFIFQNALGSLNPVLRCGVQLIHLLTGDKKSKKRRAIALLKIVGFSDPHKILRSYPHQLSGGMVQRLALALALAKKPEFLIADEPAASLDTTARKNYLGLLRQLNEEKEVTIIFATHNIDDALSFADTVLIMYAGRIAELGNTAAIRKHPAHPYTHGLLKISDALNEYRMPAPIQGESPSLNQPVSGCPFHPRCFNARESCRTYSMTLNGDYPTHFYCCQYPVKNP